MSYVISYLKQEVDIVNILQNSLDTNQLFSIEQLKEINKIIKYQAILEAEQDFKVIQRLTALQEEYARGNSFNQKTLTDCEFHAPLNQIELTTLEDQCNIVQFTKYFHQKVMQAALIAMRCRQDRLLLARGLIADIERYVQQ